MFNFFKKLLPRTFTQFGASSSLTMILAGVLHLQGQAFNALQNYIRQLQLLSDDEFKQFQSQAPNPAMNINLRNATPIPEEYVQYGIISATVVLFFASNFIRNQIADDFAEPQQQAITAG